MSNRDLFLPQMPKEEMALAGRNDDMKIVDRHYVLGSSQTNPSGNNLAYAMFGMGCFWELSVSFGR